MDQGRNGKKESFRSKGSLIMNDTKPKIVFFGTPNIAVWVLEELKEAGIVPSLVITNPDRPQGRGLEVVSTPVKRWALQHNREVLTPETLTEKEKLPLLISPQWDLFVVVAYGLIMPKWLIDLPKYGTLNVHPSLLPKLRGASPIRTSILQGMQHCGVSIMLMDEKMDHGPLLAQEPFNSEPMPGQKLDEILAKRGGKLLAKTIPSWINGDIIPIEQDHTEATFSQKITKDMAELYIDPSALPHGKEAREALLKIYAFDGNPGAYFFHRQKRIKVMSAHLEDDTLVIDRVIQEGKKETDFAHYMRNVADV
jgi:methionyl-tRNA formyltransferase